MNKLMHRPTPIETATAELARIVKAYSPLSRMAAKDVNEDLFHELADRRRSLALGIAAMTPIGWDDAEARIRALHLIVLDEFHYDEDSIVAPLIAAIARDLEFFSLPTKSAAA